MTLIYNRADAIAASVQARGKFVADVIRAGRSQAVELQVLNADVLAKWWPLSEVAA